MEGGGISDADRDKQKLFNKLKKSFIKEHIKGKKVGRKTVNQTGDFNDETKRYKSLRPSGDPKGTIVPSTHEGQTKVVVDNVNYVESGQLNHGDTGVSSFVLTGIKEGKLFTPHHLDEPVTKNKDGKYVTKNGEMYSVSSSASAGMAMSYDKLKSITTERKRNILTVRMKVLNVEMKGLISARMKAILPASMKHIISARVKDFIREAMNNIDRKEVTEILSEEMKGIGSEERKDIGGEQMKDISSEDMKDIGSEDMKDIGSEQMKDIGSEEIKDIGSEEMKDIGSEEMKNIGSGEMKDISSKEMKDISSCKRCNKKESPGSYIVDLQSTQCVGGNYLKRSSSPCRQLRVTYHTSPPTKIKKTDMKDIDSEEMKDISSEEMKDIGSEIMDIISEMMKYIDSAEVSDIVNEKVTDILSEEVADIVSEEMKEFVSRKMAIISENINEDTIQLIRQILASMWRDILADIEFEFKKVIRGIKELTSVEEDIILKIMKELLSEWVDDKHYILNLFFIDIMKKICKGAMDASKEVNTFITVKMKDLDYATMENFSTTRMKRLIPSLGNVLIESRKKKTKDIIDQNITDMANEDMNYIFNEAMKDMTGKYIISEAKKEIVSKKMMDIVSEAMKDLVIEMIKDNSYQMIIETIIDEITGQVREQSMKIFSKQMKGKISKEIIDRINQGIEDMVREAFTNFIIENMTNIINEKRKDIGSGIV